MKKNLKRFFAVVLAVAMLATQFVVPSFAATAGDPGYCNECGEHGVIGAKLHTIEATCEDGFEIYECDYVEAVMEGGVPVQLIPCPGTITVRLPADPNAHISDGVEVEAVAPNCTEDGTVAYETCTVCEKPLDPATGLALQTIVDPATGHDYVPVVTPPECEKEGYTTYTCSVCQDSYTDDEVAALVHNYVDMPGKAATCRSEGYTAYKECSLCGKIDPENPKEVLPIEDHNLKLVDHLDETCTTDGYNTFKCEKSTCPYYAGIKEILTKLGHDYVDHDAKEPTCTEEGWDAYKTCSRCDYNNKQPNKPALGHTEVTIYVAPTCTETGKANVIVCDRCGFEHHPGEEIPALGHDLTHVNATPATCCKTGNIAYEVCSVCEKKFPDGTANEDIEVAPLTTVETAKLGHDYEVIEIAPTCTEQGYVVKSCKRDAECDNSDKKGTVSEPIAATGHTFEVVAEVAPTCLDVGTEAHNKCTVCNKLYEIDVVESDIKAAAVDLVDLEIPALGHKEIVVEKLLPTYNAAGHDAGTQCERCGTPMQNAAIWDELDEAVKFHYEICGVREDAVDAVNSGSVTLKIYFDVLKDIPDDLDEYNSDVLANIFAVDFAMSYDEDAFQLAAVEVAPGAFAKAEFTPLKAANQAGEVKISQDMVTVAKEFRGKNNLFATLTFNVADDAAKGTYSFDLTNLAVVHPENEVVGISDSETSVSIEVKKLGDANEDTVFTSHDTMEISKYIQGSNPDTEYVAKYDMDKDGDIDFIDLDLLRKAIVGNDEYLTIPQ